MSIVGQLGESDVMEGLAAARSSWARWQLSDSRLVPAPGVNGLRAWLLAADPEKADGVLHALVRIGSPSGGDERAAVWLVVWALIPGAVALARRLGAVDDIDARVASQLWMEVRSFPWERLRKVAGNVLANTRAGVVRGGALARVSNIERATLPVSDVPDRPAPPVASAADDLIGVLDWAREHGVITAADVTLLLALVANAGRVDGQSRRTGQGLMSNEVLLATATTFGVSPRTVSRRARRSISAISIAVRQPKLPVAA